MKDFSWSVRVYYEDTDAAGVVYHSNYLKYMERARTEWLRSFGISQTSLREETGVIIVIAEVNIRYLMPARLDDLLSVRSELEKVSGASFLVNQSVIREDEILCTANLKGVCLDSLTFKPRRLPAMLKEGLDNVH